jgi:hypothetical protein
VEKRATNMRRKVAYKASLFIGIALHSITTNNCCGDVERR